MGMILKIALRNIGRHKRRTVSCPPITIAAGLIVFILIDSTLTGIDRMSIDNMITLSSGALKIQTVTYDKEKNTFPLNYGMGEELSKGPGRARTRQASKACNKADAVSGTVVELRRNNSRCWHGGR
jgi:ABC-type lipoprotein release transport system permease subunit